MKKSDALALIEPIETLILRVRGQRVILDADLARLYGVTTRRLNEQVKRNPGRFPPHFMFRLSGEEVGDLKSQFATSRSGWGGKRKSMMMDKCRTRASGSHPCGAAALSGGQRLFPRIPARLLYQMPTWEVANDR